MRIVKKCSSFPPLLPGPAFTSRDPVGRPDLGHEILYHLAMDIGEPEMPALEFEGELLVVDAELVQDGSLEVVDVDMVLGDVEADVVGGPVGLANLDAATRHPDGKGVRMMVPAPASAILHVTLEERGPAEFTTPDDQGLVEHATLLEVAHQSRCLLYTSPSPRDKRQSRMPSSA